MNETQDKAVLAGKGEYVSAPSLHVAWVVSSSTCLRLGRTLGPLAVGLADEGIRLTGVCGSDTPQGAFSDWPMNVIRFPMRRWFRPATAVAELTDRLRQSGVQLLHALDAEAGQTTAVLSARLNCPHVVSSYSLGDGRLVGRMGVRPAMVLAAGRAVRDDLIKSHCIPSDAVTVVTPAVYQVSEAGCFNRPDRCPCVVTSDVFDDYGAAAAVLDAFAKIESTGTEALFFAVGNGPVERMLRKHAETLGLCRSLTFVDRLDSRQLAGVFKAADIYISPRGTSSINLDALLAMASGAAVLAPDDHVSDFLIDGKTAAMFRSRDATDIARNLGELLDNHEKTASLAAGALEYLAENHRPWQAVRNVAGVYRNVLASGTSHVPLSA
ncbi:MAG: glycosyltransferase family 4 protein [Phycisphaerae bacterium]|nr:glycosyltransferase family 4 protein [Phycisphaerae bacterium]